MRYFVTGHEMLLYLSGDREEHKADRYTTVYGYMGLGDRYEQHLF